MENNDFTTDTRPSAKKRFLRRVGVPYAMAVFLTGCLAMGGVSMIVRAISGAEWNTLGVAMFTLKMVVNCLILLAFAALIKMAVDRTPFSVTLTLCAKIIGTVLSVCSVVIPRLPGYRTSGFEVFSWGATVIVDGSMLLPGLLWIIFGSILKVGFEMQKELDEIL